MKQMRNVKDIRIHLNKIMQDEYYNASVEIENASIRGNKNINSRSRFDSFTNYTPYDKNLREYGAGGAPYPDNKNLYGGDGAPYPDKNMYGGAAICFPDKFYTNETETDGIDFRSYKYRFNDYTITAYIRKRETKIKNHTGTIVAKPEEYMMILPNGDNLVLTKEQFEKLYVEL